MESSRFLSLLLLVMLFPAFLNLIYLWEQSSNPTDTSTPESAVVNFAERVAAGDSAYTDFRKPPYITTWYTPLFFAFLAGLKSSFDLNSEQLFVWGRRATLAFALLLAAVLYGRSRRDTGRAHLAAFAPLLFLGASVLFPIAVTNRPDMLAVLFSVSGVALYQSGKSAASFWGSVALFVLAFYTKQTMVAAPVAVILHLVSKDKKRAITYGAVYAGAVFLIGIALHVSTDGLSTLNLIDANAVPAAFRNVPPLFAFFLQTTPLPLILASAGITMHRAKSAVGGQQFDAAAIYFFLSLIVALATCAKFGSGTNYFLEPLAIACLLAPEGIRSLEDRRALLLSLTVVLLLPYTYYVVGAARSLSFQEENTVRALLTQSDGPVLTDNPRFAFLTPQRFMIDPIQYSLLETASRWDSTELVEMLRDGKIPLVVLKTPISNPIKWQGQTRIPQSAIDSIRKYYKLWKLLDGYYLYVPDRP